MAPNMASVRRPPLPSSLSHGRPNRGPVRILVVGEQLQQHCLCRCQRAGKVMGIRDGMSRCISILAVVPSALTAPSSAANLRGAFRGGCKAGCCAIAGVIGRGESSSAGSRGWGLGEIDFDQVCVRCARLLLETRGMARLAQEARLAVRRRRDCEYGAGR